MAERSIRIDLLGGTLDLCPINTIVRNVVTLNMALTLVSRAEVEEREGEGILIESVDYDRQDIFHSSDFEDISSFGPLSFVASILDYFCIRSGVKVTLSSDSPTGAGLGGSSAMGVALYEALCTYSGRDFDPSCAVSILHSIEGRILDAGPAGYQDYYPALYGGITALRPVFDKVEVCQLYCDELKKELEEGLTLVFSGKNRLSGVNNWEVYKRFFDRDKKVRGGLQEIADLSYAAYLAVENRRWREVLELVKQEGEVRRTLFPNIVTTQMMTVYEKLKNRFPSLGLKVCGAGGGGCFLLVHEKEEGEIIKKEVEKYHMQCLDFSVACAKRF